MADGDKDAASLLRDIVGPSAGAGSSAGEPALADMSVEHRQQLVLKEKEKARAAHARETPCDQIQDLSVYYSLERDKEKLRQTEEQLQQQTEATRKAEEGWRRETEARIKAEEGLRQARRKLEPAPAPPRRTSAASTKLQPRHAGLNPTTFAKNYDLHTRKPIHGKVRDPERKAWSTIYPEFSRGMKHPSRQLKFGLTEQTYKELVQCCEAGCSQSGPAREGPAACNEARQRYRKVYGQNVTCEQEKSACKALYKVTEKTMDVVLGNLVKLQCKFMCRECYAAKISKAPVSPPASPANSPEKIPVITAVPVGPPPPSEPSEPPPEEVFGVPVGTEQQQMVVSPSEEVPESFTADDKRQALLPFF